MGRIEKDRLHQLPPHKRTGGFGNLARSYASRLRCIFGLSKALTVGIFEKVILEIIKARAHFLIVSHTFDMERCKEPVIGSAARSKLRWMKERNIVPFDVESCLILEAHLVTEALKGNFPRSINTTACECIQNIFSKRWINYASGIWNVAVSDSALPAITNVKQSSSRKALKLAAAKPRK